MTKVTSGHLSCNMYSISVALNCSTAKSDYISIHQKVIKLSMLSFQGWCHDLSFRPGASFSIQFNLFLSFVFTSVIHFVSHYACMNLLAPIQIALLKFARLKK